MTCQGSKTEDSSLGSVFEVCKVLLEVNEVYKGLVDQIQDVNNFFNANSNQLSERIELAPMVALYFENTSKTLNLFKMNKCTHEFVTQYDSVYEEHVMLLAKIRELKVLLEKKRKRAKIGRIVTIGVAGTVFLPVVVLATVGATVGTATVPAQAGNAGEKGIESLKKLGGMLKKYENSKEMQIDLCRLIENSIEDNIGAMENIRTE